MSITLRCAASSFFGMPPIFRRRERVEALPAIENAPGTAAASATSALADPRKNIPRFALVGKDDDYSNAWDREVSSRLL